MDMHAKKTLPATDNKSSLLGYGMVLLAAAAWGTSGVFVKGMVGSSGMTALALAFWRDLFTFLVLLLGARLVRPDWLRVKRNNLPWLMALGGCLGGFHVVWNLGVLLNGAAVATVQQAVMPAIVVVAARFLWREPLTGRKILAVVLAFAGTVLVSGLDALGKAELTGTGIAAGFGIPVMYSGWNLFGKKVRQHHNPITTLTYGFGFGALVLFPFQFFTVQIWPLPPVVWRNFVALIFISTILPFAAYAFALGRLPASVAGIVAMSEIPVVAAYATWWLDERLSHSQILGAGLVILAVSLLVERGER